MRHGNFHAEEARCRLDLCSWLVGPLYQQLLAMLQPQKLCRLLFHIAAMLPIHFQLHNAAVIIPTFGLQQMTIQLAPGALLTMPGIAGPPEPVRLAHQARGSSYGYLIKLKVPSIEMTGLSMHMPRMTCCP